MIRARLRVSELNVMPKRDQPSREHFESKKKARHFVNRRPAAKIDRQLDYLVTRKDPSKEERLRKFCDGGDLEILMEAFAFEVGNRLSISFLNPAEAVPADQCSIPEPTYRLRYPLDHQPAEF